MTQSTGNCYNLYCVQPATGPAEGVCRLRDPGFLIAFKHAEPETKYGLDQHPVHFVVETATQGAGFIVPAIRLKLFVRL